MKKNGIDLKDENFINNLKLENYDLISVNIGLGSCTDIDNTETIDVTSTIRVALTGSGANGLDTGSEENSEYYAVYVIKKSDGTVAGLLSKNNATPAMPAGYTKRRRVGYVYNGDDGNIQQFFMTGDGNERTVWWDESGADHTKVLDAGSATSWTVVDCSVPVPPTAHGAFLFMFAPAGSTHTIRLKPIDFRATVTDNSSWANVVQDQSRYTNFLVPMPNNKEIRYKVDNASADVTIVIQGFMETL
jgi:hypothetical protein